MTRWLLLLCSLRLNIWFCRAYTLHSASTRCAGILLVRVLSNLATQAQCSLNTPAHIPRRTEHPRSQRSNLHRNIHATMMRLLLLLCSIRLNIWFCRACTLHLASTRCAGILLVRVLSNLARQAQCSLNTPAHILQRTEHPRSQRSSPRQNIHGTMMTRWLLLLCSLR